MTETHRGPDPQDPLIQARLMAIRNRMLNDLATHLPDEWLENSSSPDRTAFRSHLVTSKTIAEIVDIVSWTFVSVEEEESRAKSGE